MNILVSQVNVHQMASSTKEFNNQVDRITHPVDSKCFSLVTPVISQ